MSHSMTSDEKRAPLKFSRQGYNEVYRKSKDWLENRKFAVAFFFRHISNGSHRCEKLSQPSANKL
jgi:hypothetical protein